MNRVLTVSLPHVKIVCLLKQVPEPSAIEFDEETKTLKREGVPLVLNPFDRQAVRQAAELGGEVVAMTMGPPQAEEALREAVALGAARAVHLSDRVFAVADTLGTSRTLALALRKEGFDLVLCGRKSIDSETWQVPPEVAAFLGVPHLTNVTAIEERDGVLRVTRETDTGEQVYELAPPAVMSVARAALEPIPPVEADVETWEARDLVDDVQPNDKRFGQTGSPTRVLAVRDVTPERSQIDAGSVGEAAEAVRRLLGERPAPEVSWDKPDNIAEQAAATYDCWTLVELSDGMPTRHSLELIARGRDLAGKLGGKNVALVAGHDVTAAATELARHGAEAVFDVDDALLRSYHPELYTAALRQVLERHRPHVLLIPATAFGRDLGPRLAGELELGMTGDCVAVDIAKAGRLLQTKPAYGGNIVSVIMGSTTPQLATVRARMYEPLEPRNEEAEVHHVRTETLPEPRLRLVEERPAQQPGLAVDAADVLVLTGSEWLDLNGVVATTDDVSLYGRPVAPRVIIASGIEGTPEQLSGFVKAAVVVSAGEPADWADVSVDASPAEVLAALQDSSA
jgi:electron transfer flavoprotein alpha subunit